MVSIATGAPRTVRRAPAVTSVVTAGDIAAMGATTLDEVVGAIPGVHVSRAAVRYAPLFVMRGVGGGGQVGPDVLVLRDGVPMTTSYNGDTGAGWGFGIPVENIARIEVIRGPGSALYGADAFAGVINVITKTAADTPGTEFGVRGGTLGTWNAWGQYGGQLGPVAAAAYVRVGGTEGLDRRIGADAQTQNDKRFHTHASLAPGQVNTGHDDYDASVNLSYGHWLVRGGFLRRDHAETGAGVSSALDPSSWGRVDEFTADVGWSSNEILDNWNLGITGSFLEYDFEIPTNLMLYPAGARIAGRNFPNGMVGGPNHWEHQFRFSGFAEYAGWRDHQWRAGAGHDLLEIYKTRTYKNFLLNPAGVPIPTGPVMEYSAIQPFVRPHERDVDYFYVQDEWQFARDWGLTAGLRHDRYSDAGTTTNPRVALVWDTTLTLTTKLLYGCAFRAPSFNEQFGINPVASGNPALAPEEVETLEAVVLWHPSDTAQLSFNVFRFRMDNLIRLVTNPAPAPGSTFQNIGSVEGTGLELEGRWDYSRALHFTGSYSLQRAEDLATHQDAGYAPRHDVYARAEWRHASGWNVDGQLNYIGDRRRTKGDARPGVPDYTTVDFTVRNSPTRYGWQLSFSLRNVFDADVREPSLAPGLIPNDLPQAGRSSYVQATYRF
ncbi:MAG: TonB-dependent receptor [Gammaproteobacteria bacterium]|nr:TonB-dependent receptor [Gammaproteobacteria bacterium]